MRRLISSVLLSASTSQALVWAQAPPASAAQRDLATGIRAVEEGDLEAAVVALDTAIRRLKLERGSERDQATAHLYLAMAHLGLSQWERARGEMREAWRNNKGLALDPKKYPPRVIQLYEEIQREGGQAEAPPALSPPKPAVVPTPHGGDQASSKKGGSKTALLVVAGGAVAAGVAVAALKGGSPAPSPSPTPLPAPPTGSVSVRLTLNNQTQGTFSCSAGLFFRMYGSNTTASSVGLNRFDLDFTSGSPGCRSHPSPINGAAMLVSSLSPLSADILLRQVDLAGDLCEDNGQPGCSWQAHLSVATNLGSYTADIQFSTTR